MLITKATKNKTQWIIEDGWNHQTILPRPPDPKHTEIDIGLIGTRARNDNDKWRFKWAWAKGKYQFMAALLVGLDRPVYLIDVRRGGVGGRGAWAAEQFATLFPQLIRQHTNPPYSYIHLPNVAPSIGLLSAWRTAVRKKSPFCWQKNFQPIYKQSILKNNQIDVAIAFVEAAATRGGMAIFLCAEEYQPNFNNLNQQAQEECYCHRFTLANQVVKKIKGQYQAVRIHNLELTDFKHQWKKSGLKDFKNYKPDVHYC